MNKTLWFEDELPEKSINSRIRLVESVKEIGQMLIDESDTIESIVIGVTSYKGSMYTNHLGSKVACVGLAKTIEADVMNELAL